MTAKLQGKQREEQGAIPGGSDSMHQGPGTDADPRTSGLATHSDSRGHCPVQVEAGALSQSQRLRSVALQAGLGSDSSGTAPLATKGWRLQRPRRKP